MSVVTLLRLLGATGHPELERLVAEPQQRMLRALVALQHPDGIRSHRRGYTPTRFSLTCPRSPLLALGHRPRDTLPERASRLAGDQSAIQLAGTHAYWLSHWARRCSALGS